MITNKNQEGKEADMVILYFIVNRVCVCEHATVCRYALMSTMPMETRRGVRCLAVGDAVVWEPPSVSSGNQTQVFFKRVSAHIC